jgi:TolA-binding protein
MGLKDKKDDDGNLVLDENGDPILLDRVVLEEKHQRIAEERDQLKAQLDDLRGQVEELEKVTGDKAALEKQLADIREAAEKQTSELQSRLAEREREYMLDTVLLGAGLKPERLKAAKALIEDVKVEDGKLVGLDVEEFRKANEYLFDMPKEGGTGLPPRGPAAEDFEAKGRKIMGLKPKE